MKSMKIKFQKILLILLIFSSCSKNQINTKELIGDWNIYYVIYQDENLLNNYNNKVLMTGLFKIGDNGLFVIDNLEEIRFDGEIIQKKKDSLTIKNASEDLLNGKYSIKLNTENESTYTLNLNSENIEIYAEKKIADFSKFQ